MTLKITSIKILSIAILLGGCGQHHQATESNKKLAIEEEIFYLIFPRSFYDSNGDRIGDLNGVTQQLDYVQALGVTSIIMTPLYPSFYYHNYFTHDFYGIDPEFGTIDDYLNMVKEIHRRGMKFYMDTELQYVIKEHPWFNESFKNPASAYDDYVLYKDSLNAEPETMIFDLTGLKSYDGYYTDITMTNLYNTDVANYVSDYYAHWLDPNGDGSFEDGVDGFRLDSFNDDLLQKGILANLAQDFWKPIVDRCKQINSEVTFVAEQATWDDGDAHAWMEKSGVEVAYSFGIFSNLNNSEFIKKYMEWSKNALPEGKHMFVFLDHHDTDRAASTFNGSLAKLKQLAALGYLSRYIPYVYYGQEIGMRGKKNEIVGEEIVLKLNDGLDIPVREPFEWTADITDKGMALWFENIQPYWKDRSILSNDGISVEEQEDDPNSLLNFYRELLKLRSSNQTFAYGDMEVLMNQDDSVVSYCRWDENSRFVLIFNVGEKTRELSIDPKELRFIPETNSWKSVLSDGSSQFEIVEEGFIKLNLKKNGFVVLENFLSAD